MHLGKLASFFLLGSVLGSGHVTLSAADPSDPVQLHSDIAYYDGPDAHPVRHKLDIYVPSGCKDFPVVFFVHGGAWLHGNKNQFGMYAAVARTLTRHGIGMVSINYRLSPDVAHPEHIRDVARAFAWTHRNIHKYGGRPDEIFIAGHSAGGHLVALLATDDGYLKDEGLNLRAIKGAIPISGVYTIPDFGVLDKVFGKDREQRRQASPIAHARPDTPPILLIYGDNELPTCDRPVAQAFYKALMDKEAPVQIMEVARRNHISILVNAALDTDPVMQAMLSFIMAQVTIDRLGHDGVDQLAWFLAGYATHAGKK